MTIAAAGPSGDIAGVFRNTTIRTARILSATGAAGTLSVYFHLVRPGGPSSTAIRRRSGGSVIGGQTFDLRA